MTLEEYVAHLNGLAFWKEFTFAQNKFSPHPGGELELADNFVWLGEFAFVIQLKERENATKNPQAERNWFRKKVLGNATRQIRDTLRYLDEHEEIRITNERGHAFDIRGSALDDISKIVIFSGGSALPEECRRSQYHVSRSAGFIHVLAVHDYLGILEKLRVPEDIRRYFAYREQVCPKLREAGVFVDESGIMGAFLYEEALPTPASRETLLRFVQDLDQFDLSQLIGDLHDHIQRSDRPYEYYAIMLEFARVPRSVWREIKLRVMKSLEAVRKREFTLPFRLAFPATDCSFMIAPLDSRMPATGTEGEELRVKGLQNLTCAAKYDAKTSKGIGILISGVGDSVQMDWCLLEMPWEFDLEMENELANRNPFRKAKEKRLDSFLFVEASERPE